MAIVLTGKWWAFVLRGIAGVIFGVLTFSWPGLSLAVLVLLFGAYAFADGVFNIMAAFRPKASDTRWWALLIQGIVGVLAGIITVLLPRLTALALLFLIAGWAIVTGVFEISAAVRLRRQIEHEWILALSGVISIGFGALLALFPGAGALALVFWIGAYALVSGIVLMALGFRLRRLERNAELAAGHAA
jgi:uncharacterized membrane protein HdeD (DUF308 family)